MFNTRVSGKNDKAGLPRSTVKSQGKTKYFLGQGKDSGFCILSGRFFRIKGKATEKVIYYLEKVLNGS